jgi:hypothetical protein
MTEMLPIYCPVCGGSVWVAYTPGAEHQRAFWVCPYLDCQRLHPIELKGSVAEAVVRYEPKAQT